MLHILASRSLDGEPINTALLDLLVAHGANVGHADTDGNTALHIMARNLRQAKAAQLLLSRGADVGAKNLKGNTLYMKQWVEPSGPGKPEKRRLRM